jgi:hypothetical protein
MSLSLKRPLIIVNYTVQAKGMFPVDVIPRKERSKEVPRDKQPTFLNPENAFVSMMISDAL